LIEAKCQYRGEGCERVSSLSLVPPAAGGLPPPFIGQGEAVYNRAAQFQSHGVDGRHGESCFWQSITACPVFVQEGLRGWWCASFSSSRHARVISRVGLTEGRRSHSGGRGGVLSSRTPTAPGMVLSCPGSRHRSGDGRRGPIAMEETRLAALTSRRRLVGRETGVRPLCMGSAILLRGCGAWAVREWIAQCHGADTGLTAQCRIVAGMASPGGLVKQHRDMIPKRCQRDGMAWIRL
jgi:hypothetical protein